LNGTNVSRDARRPKPAAIGFDEAIVVARSVAHPTARRKPAAAANFDLTAAMNFRRFAQADLHDHVVRVSKLGQRHQRIA
jgi:hypothetical protein